MGIFQRDGRVQEERGDGMSSIDETIKTLQNAITYLEEYGEILKLNDCNTCRNKNCPYRPKCGERVRINCPLYIRGETE